MIIRMGCWDISIPENSVESFIRKEMLFFKCDNIQYKSESFYGCITKQLLWLRIPLIIWLLINFAFSNYLKCAALNAGSTFYHLSSLKWKIFHQKSFIQMNSLLKKTVPMFEVIFVIFFWQRNGKPTHIPSSSLR